MSDQIANSWICWAILLVALVCYQQLWALYLAQRAGQSQICRANWTGSSNDDIATVLICVLPLLGLLGTIVGLLDSFAAMSSAARCSDILSGGIADALLTTLLGLVFAVPGWLLQAYVRSVSNRQLCATR